MSLGLLVKMVMMMKYFWVIQAITLMMQKDILSLIVIGLFMIWILSPN